MREKIAGMNAIRNKELVIGVALRACVALKRTIGQILQMDVMALSEAKQGTNVLYQVSNLFEVPI